jgi:hypothetical protein
MRRTVISYRVRPETAAVNEELLRGVFDELARVEPDKRYNEAVLERCEEQPAISQAREIGAYPGSGSQPSAPSQQPER